jgi:hypothetical protein
MTDVAGASVAKSKRHRSQKYAAIPSVEVPDDEHLGPAMLALSPIRRRFVMELANGAFRLWV